MLFDGEVTGGEPCGPVEHVATRDGLEQWGLGGGKQGGHSDSFIGKGGYIGKWH